MTYMPHRQGFIVDPTVNDYTGDIEGTEVRANHLFSSPVTGDNLELEGDEFDREYAVKATQANIPALSPNASNEELRSFWLGQNPLNDLEIEAIQAAYVATDNEDLANLLQFRMSGDVSFLSESQLIALDISPDATSQQETSPYGDDVPDLEKIDELIFEHATDPDPDIASEVLAADIGQTDADVTVQHLAYRYYTGQLSVEDAYDEAYSSGLDVGELYQSFTKLYNHFN